MLDLKALEVFETWTGEPPGPSSAGAPRCSRPKNNEKIQEDQRFKPKEIERNYTFISLNELK